MEKKKIYIETSVISYFVSDLSENIRIAGHQLATKKFWETIKNYDVYISDIVVDEITKGNETQKNLRLNAVKNFCLLKIDDEARKLARKILDDKIVPDKFPEDALHIAVASVNNINFIVTWNFKHINNPFLKNKIWELIEKNKYICPVICSPEELIGGYNERSYY